MSKTSKRRPYKSYTKAFKLGEVQSLTRLLSRSTTLMQPFLSRLTMLVQQGSFPQSSLLLYFSKNDTLRRKLVVLRDWDGA